MKRIIILSVLLVAAMVAGAQKPYLAAVNNEDEVVHIEQWQRHAARPLQAIVKLQDYSNFTIVEKSGMSGKSGASGRVTSPAIQAVLDGFAVESVEQLCPGFVMSKDPRRSASYGGGEVCDHDLSQLYLITLASEGARSEHELIEALAALDEVEYAEPNYLAFALETPASRELADFVDYSACSSVADATYCASSNIQASVTSGRKDVTAAPNDPMYSLQWGIGACHIDSLLTAPKRDTAWRPIIAIIDTGVDVDHADLSDNIWTNSAEANGAANQDDDGNGFRDDIHGWDFVNQTGEMHDFNSHGTHCAGIAGAVTNNGIGIAGACPDALIMPVTVMQSDGSGDIATIIRGINYAAQNGADVISMSIGTYAYSVAMEQALSVAYQTAVLVAAAGNDLADINKCNNPLSPGPMFPGAFTFVLGVQATQQIGGLAGFSNYDSDGPSYSSFSEEQLYNYELSAPGVGIMSTVPNGGYRNYNGTSMACPLVAGGVASLMQRRDYLTREIIFGDLINYSQIFQPVDFWAAYNADSIAPAMLECVAIEINDTAYGDSSMYADAGERLQLYPTIRTVWGPADSVEIWLEFQEFEDTSTIQILQNHVQLGHHISSYAKVKATNPIDIHIASNVMDGRHIRLTLCATSPTATDTLRHDFSLNVTNGVKLHGMLTHNDTLWPGVQYIITGNFAIIDGAELVIKPGTKIKIGDKVSISNAGKIYAVGTPDSIITFTKTDLGTYWKTIFLGPYDTIAYSLIEEYTQGLRNINANPPTIGYYNSRSIYKIPTILHSVFKTSYSASTTSPIYSIFDVRFSNFVDSKLSCDFINSMILFNRGSGYYNITNGDTTVYHNNIINNYSSSAYSSLPLDSRQQSEFDEIPWKMNVFNNTKPYLHINSTTPKSISPRGLYLGTSKNNIAKQSIKDFDYPGSNTFGLVDLQYMEQRPSTKAHGIVWKVEVNGYDAQDEFDSIIPLGVGIHEFKVYFNRAMDTSITPMVAMGVRPPYTQTAISDNAYWSEDSTIYTTHLNLTGRMPIDGLNRIYVSGAQDDDHFEIPYEDLRFNVYVASSGSMSAGFQATPGIGKVELEWNDQEVNYDDFLGFNIYRYQYDSVVTNYRYDYNRGRDVYDTVWMPVDTIRLNQALVQDTMFTDFDVVPGERYYYYYKILSTSLTENSPSKNVSCVPYSTIPGDANGSMAVDVADVITTINYVTGQNPQPFLFDAADVNGDSTINVLDIVNIINIILYPDGRPGTQSVGDPQTAVYTMENDTLYINTPVPLAGLQFTLAGCSRSDVEVLPALAGFECATVEQDGNLTMIFYSMSGASVPFGKSPLLKIRHSEFNIQGIALSDPQGNNVIAMNGDLLGLVDINAVQAQFSTAYPNPFSGTTRLNMTVGNYRTVGIVFTDLMGKTVDIREIATPTPGQYSLVWDATAMPRGIYFATLYADGQKAQTIKLIVK